MQVPVALALRRAGGLRRLGLGRSGLGRSRLSDQKVLQLGELGAQGRQELVGRLDRRGLARRALGCRHRALHRVRRRRLSLDDLALRRHGFGKRLAAGRLPVGEGLGDLGEAHPLHAGRVELLILLGDVLAVVADALGLLEQLGRLRGDRLERAGDVGTQLLQHGRLVGQLRLKLLDLLQLLHAQGYDWLTEYANFPYQERITAERIKLLEGGGLKDLALATHGVNNGQAVKAGPVWSLVSGSEADRRGGMRMIAELDKYHGLPNGMFSCDEHLAGPNPSQGSELCTVVEYMFSLEQSLGILGDPALGDRIERLAFNALPGALTDDMWAHQYDQEPNQVECSLHREPWTTNGPESNLFGLEPNFGCCTANFHQGWPKFAASLLMLSQDDGVVAAAYAPCEARTIVRDTPVHVVEETSYPFRGMVRMKVNPASPLAFPLLLRIPAWAAGTSIKINSEAQPVPLPGTFARIERTWKAGDRVDVEFPLEPRVSQWFHDSVAVERGALVFSYGIGEDWLKLRDRGMTADWQVYPTTQWNYALALDAASPSHDVRAMDTEVSDRPFSAKGAPVKLHVKGRKLPGWQAENGVADPVPQSPVTSDQPEETIALIPYAAAKLRITAFPSLKT